jgi:hypothetical protein
MAELQARAEQGDVIARQLARVLSPAGQGFLDTVQRVLKKPPNQEVLIALFDVVRDYFAVLRPDGEVDAEFDTLRAEAETWLAQGGDGAAGTVAALPEMSSQLRAMRILSGLSYGVVRPYLKGTNAMGSLMRKKIEPVLAALGAELRSLRGG